MKYKTKDLVISAIKYDGTNGEAVTQMFPTFSISGNALHSHEGVNVSPDTVICKMDEGVIKLFKSSIFNMIFEECEDPTYHLGDDALKGVVKIRRKTWMDGDYIEYKGFCWVYCSGAEPISVYNFTQEDLVADDWMIVE